jgi:preprotein translocase SecE subunit
MAKQTKAKRGKRHLKPSNAPTVETKRPLESLKLDMPSVKTKKSGGKVPKGAGGLFGLLGKILVPPYIRNSWKELKQVTWPNWKQSRQLTFAVLVFAVIFGAAVAIVDFGLDKLFKHILLK